MATTDLEKIPLTTLRLMIPTTWNAYQDSCEWAILDRQYKVIRCGKDLLNTLPQCDEVEVVVPASMVGFISAKLPPGNQNKVLGALAFLVEADLISTPEDTHAVLAEQSAALVVVAVIAKSWVKILLEKLSKANIFPVRMFPETLLPELPPKGWAMVCRGHESFIKTSVIQGIPIYVDGNSGTPPFLLTLALEQAEAFNPPASIVLYGEFMPQGEAWQAQLGIPVVRATQQEWFVSNSKPVLNLLKGEFHPSGGITRLLDAFKSVAITLGFLITIHLILTLLHYALKVKENQVLDQAMISQFKVTFPNANTVIDASLQMKRNLEELKHGVGQIGNSDYIPLLAAVTGSIGAISVERLRGMEYQNNKLLINLLVPDMDQTVAMQKRLNAAGLSATIETPRKTKQGLELLLSVSVNAI